MNQYFKVALIFSLVTFIPYSYGKIVSQSQPCCSDSNIFANVCLHENIESPIKLHCAKGKYMLDPYINDNFTVDKNGNLIIFSIDDDENEEVTWDMYCVTNLLLPPNLNETRKGAFVCFEIDYDVILTLFLVKGILAFISVAFLMMTLYVYWILPDLRETQDKVTCVALACLMTFLLFLGIIQSIMQDKMSSFCVPFAYIVYFFTIAYFAWLNLIMANVWKTSVLPKWKIKEKKWYILNHIYGWCVPIIFTLAVYLNEISEYGLSPGFGRKSCWFADKLEAWVLLYLPISTMLLINLILFLWSIWGLNKHGNDISLDRKKAMAYKCKLYLKLFVLAGLNWSMEILSFYFGSHFDINWGWIITDVFNALHGVLIFFILIVWRRRIRKEMAGRHILCFKCPEGWANINYPEEEQLREQDEENAKYDLISKN